VQAELLRVVETRRFERVGSSAPVEVDVRILSATHRDLPVEVARGRFRDDLWYRLIALRIHVPPLRERRIDIEHLAALELAQCSEQRGGTPFELDAEGYACLRRQHWPGNVRELRAVVRRMAALAGERRLLDAQDVEQALRLGSSGGDTEAEAPLHASSSRAEFDIREREEILAVLNAHRWNVSLAARTLGLSRGALRNRLRRLGLGRGD
jgi:two-component system response regulator HupR/HoxA